MNYYYPEKLREKLATEGDYATEAEALAAFDAFLAQFPHLFKVYPEVEGYYVQPRLFTERKSPRIDRILIPLKSVVDAGWIHGPIGVEAKVSKAKAGPALAQIYDYTRAAFRLESLFRPTLMLEWIFLFPIGHIEGDIASILTQNRIGTCCLTGNSLKFGTGSERAIEVFDDGRVFARELAAGRKAGSR